MSPGCELLGGFGYVVGTMLVIWQVLVGMNWMRGSTSYLGQAVVNVLLILYVTSKPQRLFLPFSSCCSCLRCHEHCDRTTALLAWLDILCRTIIPAHIYTSVCWQHGISVLIGLLNQAMYYSQCLFWAMLHSGAA